MKLIPDLFDRIDKFTHAQFSPRHWKLLDARIATVLLMEGIGHPHEHEKTLHFHA